jgi:hypothetical protein
VRSGIPVPQHRNLHRPGLGETVLAPVPVAGIAAIVGQQRDERVPQIPRRPAPAKPASHQAHNDVGMPQRGRTPRILQPACRFSAGGACRRSGAPWWSKGMLPSPLAPFPVREHAPVVPGCGYRVSD